jgi:putative ABC transport system permease protein
MNLWENISLAVSGLMSNKMRALLTMLGIIIGIAAVIAIMTLGNSMTATVTNSMAEMGGNNIVVQLSLKEDVTSFELTEEDLISDEMLEQMREVYSNEVLAVSLDEGIGSGQIKDGRKYANINIYGVNDGYQTANNVKMMTGRYISYQDQEKVSNVAVISNKASKAIFGNEFAALGQEIKVYRGEEIYAYTVIGIYEYEENPMMAMMGGMQAEADRPTSLYIPISTAQRVNDSDIGYTYVTIVTNPEVDSIAFANTLQKFFEIFYRRNPVFTVYSMSMKSVVEQMTTIMGTMQLAIAVIAGISLLVGGIGVMNIMLVSITERTREIGTRKALGATNSSIRVQFIVEAVIICLIGGMIGILLGVAGGMLGAKLLGAPAAPSIGSIIFAMGFSMAIGVFFGYYPANKAAKMDPIEALRYE